MIIVIADDITGAAEIAGIAYRYALKTRLVVCDMNDKSLREGQESCFLQALCSSATEADVYVVATDTRSYSATDAARMITELVGVLPNDSILFHKTDSALRGNVVAELEAMGGKVIYMPANPSKGRIIRDGVYYVNEIPIHETDFRFDPEFPALTSDVHERFPSLNIPDAVCKEDVDAIVRDAIDRGLILAGAADLFTSLIEQTIGGSVASNQVSHNSQPSCRLIVCGSTQSKSLSLGLPVIEMPDDVFWGRVEHWIPEVPSIGVTDGVIMTIGDKPVREGKGAAVYLRTVMAEACCSLLKTLRPQELIIEGGATAFAIISQTPYESFEIVNEYATGVVRMKALFRAEALPGTGERKEELPGKEFYVTLKPGSYSWGNLFG